MLNGSVCFPSAQPYVHRLLSRARRCDVRSDRNSGLWTEITPAGNPVSGLVCLVRYVALGGTDGFVELPRGLSDFAPGYTARFQCQSIRTGAPHAARSRYETIASGKATIWSISW